MPLEVDLAIGFVFALSIKNSTIPIGAASLVDRGQDTSAAGAPMIIVRIIGIGMVLIMPITTISTMSMISSGDQQQYEEWDWTLGQRQRLLLATVRSVDIAGRGRPARKAKPQREQRSDLGFSSSPGTHAETEASQARRRDLGGYGLRQAS